MKRIAAIIVILVLFPTISSAAQEAAASPEAVGRVYVMSGNVTFGQDSTAADHQVNISEPIVPGMVIKTGEKSAALLKFEDGQIVTMQSSTVFQVRDYRYDAMQLENSKIDFEFFEGGVHFIGGLIGKKKGVAFSLLTPGATIRGGKAEFVVVKANNLIYSEVLAGNIRFTNSAGTASFKAGDVPVVQSSFVLASAIKITTPRGIFSELLAISVKPPLIIEPAPVAEPVIAPATPPAIAVVTTPVVVPELVHESAPAPAPAPAPALVPPSKSAPVPSSKPAPIAAPEPVPMPAPAAVTTPVIEPAPVHELAPAPASVPATVPAPVSSCLPVPVQAASSCTWTCTYSCK